jgi:transposase
MEQNMLKARELQAQGMTQVEIAAAIGKCERTIRNYLKNEPRKRKKTERPSRLDPYRAFIKDIIQENPSYNGVKIFERIQKMGFTGHISIVKEYITELRKSENRKAVIRFETEPGHQAQVDWVLLGKQCIDGEIRKLYAFTMVMGYSRMPFVCFTTKMDSATLLESHIRAFTWFGGIPDEILYDNMKTAWVYDGEKWQTNRQLSLFAYYYRFIPKRCRIHRPQTKGKVERFNKYLRDSFFCDYDGRGLSIPSLNEDVQHWIGKIQDNRLVQFNKSRRERFNDEKKYLHEVSSVPFDVRNTLPVIVNRESCITYQTNKYSVPPVYIGKTMTLKPFIDGRRIEVFDQDGKPVRIIICEKKGARQIIIFPEDREQILLHWKNGLKKDFSFRTSKKKHSASHTFVAVRNPAFYEQFVCGGAR